MSKLTADTIKSRLSEDGRGIQLVGEYLGMLTKSTFRCKEGHEWSAVVSGVLRGNGCSRCSGKMPYTTDTLNEAIKNSGFTLISEYVNIKTKAVFRCSNGHEWSIKADHVLRGSKCPHCSGKYPLTTEIVNERLKDRDIQLVDEYVSSHTRVNFKCKEGHEWVTVPANVLQGQGCPTCAPHGFNPKNSAYVYVLQFDTFIKYGITNDLKTRLRRHNLKIGKHTVIATKFFENGQDALTWENTIKKSLGGRYVTKERCPEGYTETLSLDLLNTIKLTLT